MDPRHQLGHLVKDMKIKFLEEISLFSLPVKESEIIDFFLGAALMDEVLKVMPLQKLTRAGQRPGSKHLLPLGTTIDMCVWVLSVQRKQPLPFVGPSS